MTGYSHTSESLTHAVGHDAEQNREQVATRPVNSDQAVSRRCAARGLGSLQHHHHVDGSQCDEGNAGRNSGSIGHRLSSFSALQKHSYRRFRDCVEEL
jgi:hypothetical protein